MIKTEKTRSTLNHSIFVYNDPIAGIRHCDLDGSMLDLDGSCHTPFRRDIPFCERKINEILREEEFLKSNFDISEELFFILELM
ncbi:hypothetical protein NPIL_604801 [Nephila pilipes]|uniref:Uncharacterized protein n=1 Tax=Nephila pilipes TaxID=299642 RepID=A0A8X6I590_NEPPI|nr:hypothetical protein NPIL_604801 [Nephila pilipes]